MTDNLLETIRRQMRISEERLKKQGDAADRRKFNPLSPDNVNPPKSDKPTIQAEPKSTRDVSFGEWSAYGQMTPGLLDEIADFIEENVQNVSEKLRDSAAPELTRHLQGMQSVGALLTQWADSAGYFRPVTQECSFAEMIQKALNARNAELQRCGIRIDFENAATGKNSCGFNQAFYQAILHVLQYCIEQLRSGGSKPSLSVRVQDSGDRMEINFLYGTVSSLAPVGLVETESIPSGSLRFSNVEFRAAQTLMESIGGTLVLENVSEIQKAVRIHISISALSADRNLKERSRI